jgi:hypothetical protein
MTFLNQACEMNRVAIVKILLSAAEKSFDQAQE